MKGKKPMEYEYKIGGRTYIQRPLVLAQYHQLLEMLREVQIPAALDVRALVAALDADVSHLVAVVLTPAPLWRRLTGLYPSPKRKNIEALAARIEFAATPEQIIEVVEDFFVCNPLHWILDRLILAAGTFKKQILETASKSSASSSPAETSPAATRSSGDAP